MITTRPPKTKTLPPIEVPETSPIPEPRKVIQLFKNAWVIYESARDAIRASIKPIEADHTKESARQRGIIASKAPDWNFPATGNPYSVSRQLKRPLDQAVQQLLAFEAAVVVVEDLLVRFSPAMIDSAEAYHNAQRAHSVVHLDILDQYFADFKLMKEERNNLLVNLKAEEKLLGVAPSSVIRNFRAVNEQAVQYDVDRDREEGERVKRALVAIRTRPYPIGDEFERIAALLRPFLPEGETLTVLRKVWPESDDPFAPPVVK